MDLPGKAGLSRQLECVRDGGGLLPGKSTAVLQLRAADSAWVVLALLGSAAASVRYRERFAGLALSGGYLRVGPPQLRVFPIPAPAALPGAQIRRLERLARTLTRLGAAGVEASDGRWQQAQRALDALCWPLYGLDPPADSGHASG